MADEVLCPECDERIALTSSGKKKVVCPACGTRVPVPESLRAAPEEKASPAKTKSKPREEKEEAEERPRKRKRRRHGDDPDDDVPAESGKGGGLLIGAVVVLVVLGLMGWIVVRGVGWMRDKFDNTPRVEAPFTVDPVLDNSNGPVYLADMTEFGVETGPWPFSKGELGDPERKAIKVKGVVSPKGLSMHPWDRQTTRACYSLGGKASKIRGTVALNDSDPDAWDPVVFTLVGDRKELWKSAPIKRATGPESFNVSVRGVKVLELRATAQGSHWGAHAVWIDPVLEK